MDAVVGVANHAVGAAAQLGQLLASTWNGMPSDTRLFVAVLAFAFSRRQLQTVHSFGPATAAYLLTLAASAAAVLLAWQAVDDLKDPAQVVRLASAYFVNSATLAGQTLVPLAGIVASFALGPQYVTALVAAFAAAGIVRGLLTARPVQRVVVDLQPEPSAGQPRKVARDFRIDSVPGKIVCINPCTLEVLDELDVMDDAAVDAAVKAAATAQKSWASTTFEERRHVLRVMQQCILDHAVRWRLDRWAFIGCS